MIAQKIQIEGRNVRIVPQLRQVIQKELERLQRHYREPIRHARVVLIGNSHHRKGAYEVHLVAGLPGTTLVITEKGEAVMRLLSEAFDALDRRMVRYSKMLRRKARYSEAFPVSSMM
jgi:ribosomal subunit interface protein